VLIALLVLRPSITAARAGKILAESRRSRSNFTSRTITANACYSSAIEEFDLATVSTRPKQSV
jgi:hypothetical protein